MPKVSVIIPVYNVEQYIERCARSLFEQTLDDLEYIFINDCTPDKSMEVLARTLEDYPLRKKQVKIIEMPVNSGQAKVRKIGIEAASGNYIIYCDSDDWVDKTIYEKMWKKATKNHLDMVVCGYAITDGIKNISTHYNDFKGFKSLRHGIMADEVKCYSCTKLIRRDIFRYVKEWPECNFMEDVAIIAPITYQCKFTGKIDEPLYFYYKNATSITNGSKAKEKAAQIKANTKLAIKNIKFLGGGKEFKYELMHRKCIAKLFCWDIPWFSYIWLFPEVNIRLCFDPMIPFDKKLGHLTKCFGIHGISKLCSFRKNSFHHEK